MKTVCVLFENSWWSVVAAEVVTSSRTAASLRVELLVGVPLVVVPGRLSTVEEQQEHAVVFAVMDTHMCTHIHTHTHTTHAHRQTHMHHTQAHTHTTRKHAHTRT